ncbi:MAG: hypothetical protein JNM27_02365 [Leptospirales bacterium]|nr:hypothetical protein [Leptospirales bacterium]
MIRRNPAFIAIALSGMILISCARFRVQELKPARSFAIPLSAAFPSITKGADEYTRPLNLAGIPLSAGILGNRIFLSDPSSGVVRVFKRNSDKPEFIIGDKMDKSEEAELIKVRAGIPCEVVSDDDENAFIAVHEAALDEKPEPEVPPENRFTDKPPGGQFTTTPARIVQIKDDAVIAQFGREGREGPPFERILRMHAFENTLYVFHSIADAKALSVFQNGKRIRHLESFAIKDQDITKYFVDIEDIFPAGQTAIVSVALRNKNTFAPEQRRIYSWEGGDPRLLYTIDEEGDQFIAARPDGGFTLANSEDGNRLLLKIYSPSGEYLNNRLLVFPDFRNSWREVSLDMTGRVFSNRIFQGKFEVYEWK